MEFVLAHARLLANIAIAVVIPGGWLIIGLHQLYRWRRQRKRKNKNGTKEET